MHLPKSSRENVENANKTSGSTSVRDPEPPALSTSRVQAYMPDNVFARLFYTPNTKGGQVATNERAIAMEALVDGLSRVVATGTNNVGA